VGNLYSRMKVFHFKDKIDSLPRDSGRMLPPLHVRVKPTNRCNHHCRYCAYTAEGLQLGQDMNRSDSIPREKMLEIVQDFIDMGVKAVTFSGGGEPLAYPHLTEVLKKLAESTIKFATLTNGALLQGEVAELFARRGTWVRVSMDGWDDASYAEYRGISVGEFSKVMENMRSFKQLGGNCLLGVSYIVDQKNAEHVYEFVERIKDAGVDSLKISPCIVSNDGHKNNEYHSPMFSMVKEQIARAKDRFEADGFEIFDSYHELENKFSKEYSWCPYSQILPVVGADQNIYPCQDKAYNLAEGLVGSIAEQSFRQFWEQGKEAFFRINPSVHCNHHCVANEKNKILLDYLDTDVEHLAFV
jgi:MoaA/NifB/PqqE/SkfB family radical SAM enzyme